MASARMRAWVERILWLLVYLGLFAVLLGWLTYREHEPVGTTLVAVGAVAVFAGAVLVWVRSRMEGDA